MVNCARDCVHVENLYDVATVVVDTEGELVAMRRRYTTASQRQIDQLSEEWWARIAGMWSVLGTEAHQRIRQAGQAGRNTPPAIDEPETPTIAVVVGEIVADTEEEEEQHGK